MNREFKAPWDTLLRSLSVLITVIMLGFPVFDVWNSGGLKETGHMYLIVLFPVLLIIFLLFTIRSYTICGQVLLVKRLFWNTKIELTDVQSCRFDSEGLKGAVKTLGNGGAFSYSGWFYSKKLGKFRVLATNRNELVILTFRDGKSLVISPENPQLFLEDLRKLGIQTDNS